MIEMKELFEVRFHPNGDGFEMDMVNGTLDVPDEKGCYVLSTGCGSGKTECCKSIIRQKADDGILYCVDTIAELDKMYKWIVTHGTEFGVSANDVIIISSDKRHEYFLHQYQNSPDILMGKKIVLITHVRFWTDLINYFLIYRPKTQVEAFDCDFRELMSRGDLRKYVIFDETPRFIQPFFSMPKTFLSSFSYTDEAGNWQCCTRQEVKRRYNYFFKNHPTSPFPKSNTAISDIKRSVIFKMIPEYFDRWINSTDSDVEISFTPLHLSQHKINTHIIVLEGAGNVLFEGSQYYKLIDVKQKYNCRVQFSSFPFYLKRRKDQIDAKAFSHFMDWCHNHIRENQINGKKTLLVVWKTHGKDTTQSQYTYCDAVAHMLSECGDLDKDMYRVIYYGSSESKSTNEFRDFNEIILAGKWSIPNTDTQKFKLSFGVDVDNNRHRLWAFIQLLCRIGIRLHDGKDYSVLYSSDFSDDFIDELKGYMENKDLSSLNMRQADDIPEWLEFRFDRAKVRSNFRKEIMALCQLDEFILYALQREETYSLRISLDDLYDLIPRDRRKRSRYDNLRTSLRRLGIKLEIK